tara:strand:+ start:5976 stop:6962 length:987 start_codon:yes stop_codon:yes gene_type:complete
VNEPWHAILTPAERAGAIAMIQVQGDGLDRLGFPLVPMGQIKRADLFGIDDGVIYGVDTHTQILMPHGGVAILRRISEELSGRGCPVRDSVRPHEVYPEATNEIEAWCMHALSVMASPLGVDVLLDHTARWFDMGCASRNEANGRGRSSVALNRLINPPTVVAVGRANIGKSSLLNTLVGQRVALVADVVGTTRDHVGVPVDLGGVVVRWIDTPGVDERVEDADEIEIAARVVANADLVIHCIDADDERGVLDSRLSAEIRDQVSVVRLGMRSDLGHHPCGVDVRVCTGQVAERVGDLVALLRDQLVPSDEIDDPCPWRFWESLAPEA